MFDGRIKTAHDGRLCGEAVVRKCLLLRWTLGISKDVYKTGTHDIPVFFLIMCVCSGEADQIDK